MKRDMEVIRGLLLWMEEQEDGLFSDLDMPPMPTEDSTFEHLQMLVSAGYLAEKGGGFRITWEGHEFLDKVRDDEIWRKTKEGATKIGSWSVKLLGELAAGLLRQKAIELGLPLA